MGVNHVHEHGDERTPEEVARDRAARFVAALEAVRRDHAGAIARADDQGVDDQGAPR